MTVFSSEYYVGDDEIKNTKGYNIAAVLCAVMIIALTITTVVLGSKNAYELETVPSFELRAVIQMLLRSTAVFRMKY